MGKYFEEKNPSASRRDKIVDDLKMLRGLPPYDTGSNICRGDGYFARSLEKKYGKTIEELAREVNFGAISARWEAARRLFAGDDS